MHFRMRLLQPRAEVQCFPRKALAHIHQNPGICSRVTEVERLGEIMCHINRERVCTEDCRSHVLPRLSAADKENSPAPNWIRCRHCITSTANHTLKLSAAAREPSCVARGGGLRAVPFREGPAREGMLGSSSASALADIVEERQMCLAVVSSLCTVMVRRLARSCFAPSRQALKCGGDGEKLCA